MNNANNQGLENRYDSLELITQEVLKRYAETPDPRLRELMLSIPKKKLPTPIAKASRMADLPVPLSPMKTLN